MMILFLIEIFKKSEAFFPKNWLQSVQTTLNGEHRFGYFLVKDDKPVKNYCESSHLTLVLEVPMKNLTCMCLF